MRRHRGRSPEGLARRLVLGVLGAASWLAGAAVGESFLSGVGVGLLVAALLLGFLPHHVRRDGDGP